MIDIHSHIIFDVDDGAKNLTDSLNILEQCVKNGVQKIIATSHRRKGMFETDESKILQNFKILKEESLKKFPNLELYYGAEIFYTRDIIKKLENNMLPSLANSDYVLIEFDYNIFTKEVFDIVYEVKILGKIPIIAHIERYNNLACSKNDVERLIEMGAYIQINSSSAVRTRFFVDYQREYKKRAKFLLDKNLVHFVASDVHNITSRKTLMKDAFKHIEKKYGVETARELFLLNQIKVLENRII